MDWKELLKPNKTKILLSFLITFVWIGIRVLVTIVLHPNTTIIIPQVYGNLITVLDILFIALWSYPSASALYHLWFQHKKKKLKSAIKEKKTLFSIIVFNPVTLTIITTILFFSLIYYNASQLPDTECGLNVVGVFSDSPAERAGLHSGLTIISIDGETMETVSEFSDLIKNKKPGDKIVISSYLNGSTYVTLCDDRLEITLEEYPTGDITYGYIGVNLTQRITKSGYPCK